MERRKNAFTLIELLVVIAIIALLIGILLPALGQAQRSAKNVLSQSNMRSLNTGAANYAADNSDLVFSYSWKAKVTYHMPDGRDVSGNDDTAATGYQNQEILQRVTGRVGGQFKIKNFVGRLPHRRYSHLVLLDFLTDVQPEPTAASPFDRNLIQWQEDPTDYRQGSTVPYANDNSSLDLTLYEAPGTWDSDQYRQRWPFASTYQVVPAAWNSDGLNGQGTYIPLAETTNLFTATGAVNLGRRKFTQVAHPSGKVLMFEEFDRFSDKDGLFFAYPEAKCNLAFFDGSVRNEQTADANAGWNPAEPGTDWVQIYKALDTFPEPRDSKKYCQRYRWTRYGLQGIDFGGSDIGRLQYPALTDPPTCVVQ